MSDHTESIDDGSADRRTVLRTASALALAGAGITGTAAADDGAGTESCSCSCSCSYEYKCEKLSCDGLQYTTYRRKVCDTECGKAYGSWSKYTCGCLK
jgi:hypothetical protein